MLDHKIEDYDASIELLENRKKKSKYFFMMLYLMGFFLICSFILTSIYNVILAIAFGFMGIGFMIIATWFLIVWVIYENYLFMINKKLVHAKKEREL